MTKIEKLALQLLKDNREAGCLGHHSYFLKVAEGALSLTGQGSMVDALEFIRKEGQVICLHRANL